MMPSAHGQHYVMMEDKSLESAALTQTAAESNVFICTECGEGFNQYHQILTHMALHGPLETFPSSSGSSNGFEFPKEYVLQENGTLTMINGSQSANLPSLALPSPLHPAPCNDAAEAKPTVGPLDTSSPVQNTGRGLECTLCSQIFGSKEELRKHLHDHAHDRFHCCGLCGKRFLTVDSLNIHRKEYHIPPKPKSLGKVDFHGDKKVEKTYSCKKCGSDFFWLTDFQTHSLYVCKGLRAVKKPLKTLVVSNDMCQLNGKSDFKPLASPEITDNANNCQSYQCGLCGDRFDKLVALKEHHLIHQTQEETDQLNQEVQRTFHTTNSMQRRCRRSKASFTDKGYRCKLCHSVFHHSSSLSRHMRDHKKIMPKCVFCAKVFPQHCDLAKHVEVHHQAELEKQPVLKSMKRGSSSFDSQHGLAKQEKRGMKAAKRLSKYRGNYKCEVCGKKFGLLWVYQRHVRYHHGPTENLGSKFNISSSLELHILKDRGAQIAQKTVPETYHGNSIKDDNKRHIINDILYECNVCAETFYSLQIFLQHQNSHSTKNCG